MIRIGKATGNSLAIMVIAASFAAGCSSTDTRSANSTSQDANYLASAEPEEQEERLICRREQPTGSRISERVCMTAEDWDKIERQSREMLDRTTRKAQQYEDN
jgi:hypothetical protein